MTGTRHRMGGDGRHELVSRVIASLFIVLIVLPFTAPFQTIDLDALHQHGSAHTVGSADKVSSKDITVTTSHLAPTFTAPVARINAPITHSTVRDRQPLVVALRV